MSKVATFAVAMSLALMNCTRSYAQSPCSGISDKLICVIPQLYNPPGEGGVVGLTLANPAHRAHFGMDSQADIAALTALTGTVGSQSTALRLASPASGIIFAFDKRLAVVKRSTESYGPILGERAETIGRHRFFIAGTYQYFPFSTLDGIDLKRIPSVFTHGDTVNPDGTHRNPGIDPPSPGDPVPEREYVRNVSRIDLKIHQVTFYATYGLTNRIDVSVAVPILNVRLGASSQATIVRAPDTIQPISSQAYQMDPTSLLGRLYAGTGPTTDCAMTLTCSGYFHYFDVANPATSVNATFSNFNSATGIGDVEFRVKGTVYQGERVAIALGTDVRAPSGDEKNFLGSGAAGFKPFVVASYQSRISPHVNLGYEFNGRSILAGDLRLGTKGGLPDQFFYSGGVDAAVGRTLTLAIDILGERVFDAPEMVKGPFLDVLGTAHPDVPQTRTTRRSFNMNDLAAGAKYNLHGNLLLTGNVQFKLDNGGLRAKIVPLIGISYTF